MDNNFPDLVFDDSALAYASDQGLVIITGFSHAGTCRIVAHARKVCGEDRIGDIIGGFHLLNPSVDHRCGSVAVAASVLAWTRVT